MPGIGELHGVVTAGGTREPIDDVRVVANVSSGRLGAAIATALVDAGVRTTLVGSRELLSHPEWIPPQAATVPFLSYRDLDDALGEVIARDPPDLLFMAAAVADYSPVPSTGKIRSDGEELVIRMRKNPKILGTLRQRCGEEAVLVGFKLLSGSSRSALEGAALAQVRRDRLDLTVANDLSQLTGADHPALLVTGDGVAAPIRGAKSGLAEELVRRALALGEARGH